MAPSSGKTLPDFSFQTRQRAWDALKARTTPVNVLVIGGGIVGAGLLRELARHQVPDIFLVEKNDFASGTSHASSKLIHAGIRYLEQAWDRLREGRLGAAWRDFNFVLQASNERKVLGCLAPGLVRPKEIFFVLGDRGGRQPLSVLFGTWAYYLIQIFQGQFFAPPRIFIRRASIQRRFPDLAADRVRAVFSFWDSETDDARLVIENLQSSVSLGASAMNYVELVSFEEKKDVVSVVLRNRESDETAVVSTRMLINASGAHVDDVAARGGRERAQLIDRVAGAHIDIHPPVTEGSFYITADDDRLVFVLQRNEDGLVYSRIGTTERPLKADESSDDPQVTKGEMDYLLGLVGAYFPSARLDGSAIIGTDAGIRALYRQPGTDPFKKSREHAIVGDGRVFHFVGVKLTDFRRVAREAIETLPWKAAGVQLAPAAEKSPLRSSGEKIYRESSMEDVVSATMVLHWDDYVLRRRGAEPRLLRRDNDARLEKDLASLARLLGWDAERVKAEKARLP